MIASSVTAAGVLLPATASYAATAPAPQPKPVAAQKVTPGEVGVRAPQVEVIKSIVDSTAKIITIVRNAIEKNQNRPGYVKSLMEGLFYENGQHYNVMVINNSNGFSFNLHGLVYDARVSGIHGTYRVFVFESGEFTNHGDGGWINWGFRGWFTQNGNHVNFRRP
ncbi:stress protein [Streptomyces sp. NPDC001985]|uniref:stress protein n=1 Tax=Streptomyces sp. NPDC001985 TaxID=3154406 RepID=UPI003323E7D4